MFKYKNDEDTTGLLAPHSPIHSSLYTSIYPHLSIYPSIHPPRTLDENLKHAGHLGREGFHDEYRLDSQS